MKEQVGKFLHIKFRKQNTAMPFTFSLRDINLSLELWPSRIHVIWRVSVGVGSSRLGLKSERADIFQQSSLCLLRHTDELQ